MRLRWIAAGALALLSGLAAAPAASADGLDLSEA